MFGKGLARMLKGIKTIIWACLFIVCINQIGYTAEEENNVPAKHNIKVYNTLTFDDLVNLSKDESYYEQIKAKVDYVLNNPVVDNTLKLDATVSNIRPELGPFIRVGSWNIERGMQIDDMINIFINNQQIKEKISVENPDAADIVTQEARYLSLADIMVFIEVDAGMPRTKYRNIAEYFGEKAGYNYAYGVEFLEIDPAHLGIADSKWSEEHLLFGDNPPAIIPEKYKGLHGTAIVSRFPLENVRILRYPEYYDWYKGEEERISKTETIKRMASAKIFSEGVIREIRLGSRMALIADAKIPGLEKPLTVVATHLENRTRPKFRKKQIKMLLNHIKTIDNPVVIAGDFNTDIADCSPVNTRKHHNFILRHCKIYNIPRHYIIKPIMALPNALRKHDDPTIRSIPIFSSNPERGLFNVIRKFEFNDNYHFDFRSTPGKYTGKHGNLANSNQRAYKGFVPTFMFERPLYVGKFKLDWLFVKAYADKAKDKHAPFKMAPHYGTTLFDLNYSFKDSLSDHCPITVDLPINEPPELTKKEIKEIRQVEKQQQRIEKVQDKKDKQSYKIQKEDKIKAKQNIKDLKKNRKQLKQDIETNKVFD
jgi:endonuclease/exonuclease/phosphatase family metal-dependent hydrolase